MWKKMMNSQFGSHLSLLSPSLISTFDVISFFCIYIFLENAYTSDYILCLFSLLRFTSAVLLFLKVIYQPEKAKKQLTKNGNYIHFLSFVSVEYDLGKFLIMSSHDMNGNTIELPVIFWMMFFSTILFSILFSLSVWNFFRFLRNTDEDGLKSTLKMLLRYILKRKTNGESEVEKKSDQTTEEEEEEYFLPKLDIRKIFLRRRTPRKVDENRNIIKKKSEKTKEEELEVSKKEKKKPEKKDKESTSDSDSNSSDESSDEEEETTKKEKLSSFGAIKKLAKILVERNRCNFGLTFILILVKSQPQIFLTYYSAKLYNAITGTTIDHGAVREILLLFAAFTLIKVVLDFVENLVRFILAEDCHRHMKKKVFASIMKQELYYFENTGTGSVIGKVTHDCDDVTNRIRWQIVWFSENYIQCLCTLVFMLSVSWRMTLVVLMSIPIAIILQKIFTKRVEKGWRRVHKRWKKWHNEITEVIGSMQTVRSFANEEEESKRYGKHLDETSALMKKQGIFLGTWRLFENILNFGIQLPLLYYGAHLVSCHAVLGADLLAFVQYQLQLSRNMEAICWSVICLSQVLPSCRKVVQILERKPKIRYTDGQIAPKNIRGEIEFQNVTFRYPSRPNKDVFKNVSFKVEPGQVVAIVGPSGSGKTTCISLLKHFYEPQEGQILLDSKPIQFYRHTYLQEKMTLVDQEPSIYKRTIRENISYGCKYEVTAEEVEKAAKQANAHGFITDLKKGYETNVGEKGVRLSGGQKQRIAIARAVVRNPPILLLDEATSALDADSEYLVQQALLRNIKNRTVIVIAHRLSTIRNADKIIVIDEGRKIEEGNHEELFARKGRYYRLVQKQIQGFIEKPSGLNLVKEGCEKEDKILKMLQEDLTDMKKKKFMETPKMRERAKSISGSQIRNIVKVNSKRTGAVKSRRISTYA